MSRVVVEPTSLLEGELIRSVGESLGCERAAVVGLDEVGRGALAGPVMVGAFALVGRIESTEKAREAADVLFPPLPGGIRDSKLVSPKKRETLFGELSREPWVSAVGRASAAEIDELGIVSALGIAAERAWSSVVAELVARAIPVAAAILDGNINYLAASPNHTRPEIPIHVRIKGDQDCVSVASASILAKVTRDRHMVELSRHAPEYGWGKNKGYGSAGHRAAIAQLGLHPEHRSSWNLVPSQPSFDGLLEG